MVHTGRKKKANNNITLAPWHRNDLCTLKWGSLKKQEDNTFSATWQENVHKVTCRDLASCRQESSLWSLFFLIIGNHLQYLLFQCLILSHSNLWGAKFKRINNYCYNQNQLTGPIDISTNNNSNNHNNNNVKTKVVPIVVGALGAVTPNLSKHLDAIAGVPAEKP